MSDTQDLARLEKFAPCPTCRQYSHSIPETAVAEAFNHFQSMVAHPVRGHPMGNAFDDRTRDMAQILLSRISEMESALREARRLVSDAFEGVVAAPQALDAIDDIAIGVLGEKA